MHGEQIYGRIVHFLLGNLHERADLDALRQVAPRNARGGGLASGSTPAVPSDKRHAASTGEVRADDRCCNGSQDRHSQHHCPRPVGRGAAPETEPRVRPSNEDLLRTLAVADDGDEVPARRPGDGGETEHSPAARA